MKIIDRYILRELTGPFAFGVAVFSAILVSGFILPQLFSLFGEASISLGDAFLLFVYSLPRYLVHTLAMSVLLAVLMGFGRLSSESETVALHGAGASLGRLAVPGVIFGVLISLLSLFLGQRVIPYTNQAADTLLVRVKRGQREGKRGMLAQDTSAGVKRTIIAASFSPASGTMREVTVIQFDRANVPTSMTYAREARADEKAREWTLYDGYNKSLGGSLPAASVGFSTQRIRNIAMPGVLAASSKRSTEMTNQELRREIALLQGQKLNAGLFQVEYYRRMSLPFACLVFALIGTPLGMRSHRRSSSIGVGLTLIIVFAYFIVSQWLGIIGEGGALNPVVAVWLPNAFFALAGIVLIATARK